MQNPFWRPAKYRGAFRVKEYNWPKDYRLKQFRDIGRTERWKWFKPFGPEARPVKDWVMNVTRRKAVLPGTPRTQAWLGYPNEVRLPPILRELKPSERGRVKVDLAKIMKIERGDLVKVTEGPCQGHVGRIKMMLRSRNQVIVEGANMHAYPRNPHWRPGHIDPEHWRVDAEYPIHITNVSLVDPVTRKRTRVSVRRTSSGERVRVSKVSGCALYEQEKPPVSARELAYQKLRSDTELVEQIRRVVPSPLAAVGPLEMDFKQFEKQAASLDAAGAGALERERAQSAPGDVARFEPRYVQSVPHELGERTSMRDVLFRLRQLQQSLPKKLEGPPRSNPLDDQEHYQLVLKVAERMGGLRRARMLEETEYRPPKGTPMHKSSSSMHTWYHSHKKTDLQAPEPR